MTELKPLGDRILVKRIEAETMYKGLIFIPDSRQEKPQMALVIAVGPGREEKDYIVPPAVKVGDKVMFGKYSGTEIKLNGEDLTLMREGDILGIVIDQ